MNSTLALAALFVTPTDSQAFNLGQSVGQVLGIVIVIVVLIGFPVAFITALVRYSRVKTSGRLTAVIVTGLLCLIAVVALTAMVGFGIYQGMERRRLAAPSPESAPAERMVQTLEGELRIRMSDSWSALTVLNDDAEIQVGNLAREEYLIVVKDLKEDYDGSLRDFAEQTSGAIIDSLTRTTSTELADFELSGKPALRREMSGTLQTARVEYMFTAVEGSEHYFQILAWTLRSKKNTAFKVFRDVLQTCEIR